MENNSSSAFQSKTLLEALNNPTFTLIALLLILIIIFAICGNLVVIRTVCVTRKLHYPAFYFVVSLAVADFLVGFLVVPVSLVYHATDYMEGKWILGETACDFSRLASIWFTCASLLNLCVVSWDRYLAVTSPLSYNLRMRDSKVKFFIGSVWTISLFFSILYTLGYKFSPATVLCTIGGLPTSYTVLAFILLFFLPTSFVIFVNCGVLKIARKHRRQIDDLEYSVSVSGLSPAPSTTSLRRKSFHTQSFAKKKSQKTYKMLLVIIIAYIVCWTPFFLTRLIRIFIAILEVVSYMGVILTYLNSAVNPFIYGAFNREFRTAVKRSLRRRRARIGISNESSVLTSQANTLQLPKNYPFLSTSSL